MFDVGIASSSGKRIKTLGSKRKDKEPERSYSSKFLSRKHERHFNIVQDRRLLMERKARLILDFAPQFGEQLENRNWERLATYPAPANIAVVKEFYTNARQLGDHPNEEYMSYVRGHIIQYDLDAINRRADLTPLAKYWMAFSHANIQPYSHVSDITVSRALLLYCVLRGMSINIGQVIANDIQVCANTMDNKAPLGNPSLITHLCELAGVNISTPSLERPRKAIYEAYYRKYCSGDEAAQPVPPRHPRRGRGPPQAPTQPHDVAKVEKIIGLYDTTLGHRWTMDEFNNVVAWLEDQAQASGAGSGEAPTMDDDEDDEDDFEDAEEEGEEEDSDDSMG
ncbi:hypothetical protein LR48_Vigan06g088500 [Vigna angularis]|uniref:Putative plant transposon protein domain-containing protein n=1 Tax=Phaseolus angularis TaxID=3914 RepID=A0A0L9USR6_PHAAN|nr:hypothetical protein LR48_Vigan06g088500 [Vigna angularis]